MKKQTLFNIGAKALEKKTNIDELIYLCPICLRGFYEDAIEEGLLTYEHVPQESIGGKEVLLTCKECNDQAGYKIDSELDKREEVNSIFKALKGETKYAGRATLNFDGIPTNVKIKIENEEIRFEVPKKINNPNKRDQLFSHLYQLAEKGEWGGEKFNFQSLTNYHKHRAKIADLKTAYLAAFAIFGYTYILREDFDLVRNQIISPDKELLTNNFLIYSQSDLKAKRQIITINEPINCIGVQIDTRIVLLPPIEYTKNPFVEIEEFISNKNNYKRMTGSSIPWPTSPKMVLDSNN